MSAQLAAMALNEQPPERTEPLTIGSNAPPFTYSPLARPDSMIRLLKIKPGIFRADPVDCDRIHFDIRSAPGRGATFTFSFPLSAVAEPRTAQLVV